MRGRYFKVILIAVAAPLLVVAAAGPAQAGLTITISIGACRPATVVRPVVVRPVVVQQICTPAVVTWHEPTAVVYAPARVVYVATPVVYVQPIYAPPPVVHVRPAYSWPRVITAHHDYRPVGRPRSWCGTVPPRPRSRLSIRGGPGLRIRR